MYEISNFFEYNLVLLSSLRYGYYSLRRERKCADIAFFCRFFTATRRITVSSKNGYREENLHIELHFSFIDQFAVPPIFNNLTGAKNVDIGLVCTFEEWRNPRMARAIHGCRDD